MWGGHDALVVSTLESNGEGVRESDSEVVLVEVLADGKYPRRGKVWYVGSWILQKRFSDAGLYLAVFETHDDQFSGSLLENIASRMYLICEIPTLVRRSMRASPPISMGPWRISVASLLECPSLLSIAESIFA